MSGSVGHDPGNPLPPRSLNGRDDGHPLQVLSVGLLSRPASRLNPRNCLSPSGLEGTIPLATYPRSALVTHMLDINHTSCSILAKGWSRKQTCLPVADYCIRRRARALIPARAHFGGAGQLPSKTPLPTPWHRTSSLLLTSDSSKQKADKILAFHDSCCSSHDE